MKKGFFTIALVLLLCVSSVWAFPSSKGYSEGYVDGESVLTASDKAAGKSKISDGESAGQLSKLKELQIKSKGISKKEVQALAAELAAIDEDYQELTIDANRIHPYVNAGAVFGLNADNKLKVGAMANGGIKFKSGFTLGVNTEYFFVNTDTKKFVNNFSASIYTGWMF